MRHIAYKMTAFRAPGRLLPPNLFIYVYICLEDSKRFYTKDNYTKKVLILSRIMFESFLFLQRGLIFTFYFYPTYFLWKVRFFLNFRVYFAYVKSRRNENDKLLRLRSNNIAIRFALPWKFQQVKSINRF